MLCLSDYTDENNVFCYVLTHCAQSCNNCADGDTCVVFFHFFMVVIFITLH